MDIDPWRALGAALIPLALAAAYGVHSKSYTRAAALATLLCLALGLSTAIPQRILAALICVAAIAGFAALRKIVRNH